MTSTCDIQGPAASYSCSVGLASCTLCRPDPSPCDEWQGIDGETGVWCPKCGWTEWAHVVAVAASAAVPTPTEEPTDGRA